MVQRFNFGLPVAPCPPSASSPRGLFVLGAYPSALHVAWGPPPPWKPVKALAVANEPEPFWMGADEHEHIERWKASVGFSPAWGRIGPCGNLNGSSGVWVERNVLAPLGVARGDAWITDCLDTYRGSTGGSRRIKDKYAPFAAANGLPAATFYRNPRRATSYAMRCEIIATGSVPSFEPRARRSS